MSTRFAVIVTCYNYKAFVEEAVDSALAQTRPAAQVIVVDDGSTDGSTELLKQRYGNDPRVTLLCGENGGQLVAFQRGMAVADADVVCFLDADDRWEPDHLQKIGAIYDERSDIGFVFTDIRLFGDEERVIGFEERPVDLGYTVVSTYTLCHWYGAPTSAISLRSDFARRALDLPRDFGKTWRLCADNCLVYGASMFAAKKYYLPTGSVGYRVHGKNGWWSNRGPTSTYLNRLQSRSLVRYYASMAGVDDTCFELAKYEYKTKPNPPWSETKRYASLSLRGTASWLKRYERALTILAGRRKAR